MNKIAEESFSNVRTVKAFSGEEREIQLFKEGNDKVYAVGFTKSIYTGIFSFLWNFCLYGAMAYIVYHAGNMYFEDMITLGGIASYVLYLQSLIVQLRMVGYVLNNVGSVFAASDRVHEFVSLVPEIPHKGGKTLPDDEVLGTLELRDVKFHYP
jgi:ABC-type multidrug transport system fused ATPase/permease subunit